VQTIGTILYIGAQLGGLALHLWTAYIAFRTGSFLLTVGSLIFPFGAEIYWFFRVWSATGDFINLYSLACFAVIGSYGLGMLVISVGAKAEERKRHAPPPSPDFAPRPAPRYPQTEEEKDALVKSLRERLERSTKEDEA
jgi:hypothetical protein